METDQNERGQPTLAGLAVAPRPAPATPIEAAKSRLSELEDYVTKLEPRLATAFNEVDEALVAIREQQQQHLGAATLSALVINQLREALTELVSDPNNPTTAARKAREILEAPIDLDAFTGSDAVAGEPEGDPAGDAG